MERQTKANNIFQRVLPLRVIDNVKGFHILAWSISFKCTPGHWARLVGSFSSHPILPPLCTCLFGGQKENVLLISANGCRKKERELMEKRGVGGGRATVAAALVTRTSVCCYHEDLGRSHRKEATGGTRVPPFDHWQPLAHHIQTPWAGMRLSFSSAGNVHGISLWRLFQELFVNVNMVWLWTSSDWLHVFLSKPCPLPDSFPSRPRFFFCQISGCKQKSDLCCILCTVPCCTTTNNNK